MFHHRPSSTPLWAWASALALALPLALGAAPASATIHDADPAGTSGPRQADPSHGIDRGTAQPGTTDAVSAPVADNPQGAAEAAETIRDLLTETPEPGNAERKELAQEVAEALGTPPDATLGQGVRRIEETGDPQVPTVRELEQLADIADASAEAAGGGTAEKAGRGAGASGPGASNADASVQADPEQAPTAAGTFVAQPASYFPTSLAAPAAVPAHPQDALRSWRPPGVLGVDVAHHQGDVDWNYAWNQGVRFAYIKATQSWPSKVFTDPKFGSNYSQTYQRGIIRGAYHFALPAHSSGATQAREFVSNGGGWSADGKTLPPLLDIEWNPYDSATYPQGKGNMCYGMTPAQMVTWIKDFGNTLKSLTGRLPMIYTAQSWWDVCTGDSTAFKGWPLHVALYPTASSVPKNPRELPEGWRTFNVWQYSSYTDLIGRYKADGNVMTVDGNVWNGDLASLKAFALNRGTSPRLTTEYLGNGDVVPTRLAPVRVAGGDRYATAIALSRKTFPFGAKAAVVASGLDFPDALTGSPLAAAKAAPLLLTHSTGIGTEVLQELRRLKPQTIYLMGSSGAVNEAVRRQLAAIAPVSRVYGADRYSTGAKAAALMPTSSTAFLATGEDFPDALSLAAVASQKKSPLLLTRRDGLPAETLGELKRRKPSIVAIAGSSAVVSDRVVQQVRSALPDARVVRHAGSDRYGTSAAISNAYWGGGSQRQFFATGVNYPDGLTGAVAAAHNGAPLLMTRAQCMPAAISGALTRLKGWTNVLVGSAGVLADTAVYQNNGKPNIC